MDSAAASTRARVSGRTLGSSFNTRETVLMATPAAFATSWMVFLLTWREDAISLGAGQEIFRTGLQPDVGHAEGELSSGSDGEWVVDGIHARSGLGEAKQRDPDVAPGSGGRG